MRKALWALVPLAPFLLVELAVTLVPVLLMRLVGLRRAADRWTYANMALQSRFILFLLGVRTELSGDEAAIKAASGADGAVCIVSNHTSILDILVLYGVLHAKGGFIAKRQVLAMPLVNIWVPMSHSVFIDRRSMKKGAQAIRKGQRNLGKGVSMFIFPEGTRSRTGMIGPFKRGAFRLASETRAVVVPVTIKGLRRSLEDRRHLFQSRICHLHVSACTGFDQAQGRLERLGVEQEIENEIHEAFAALPED